jgi:hypothetical protein
MRPRFFALLQLGIAVVAAQQYPFIPVPNAPKVINRLFQDSQSRLWVATDDDVQMFDGLRFYSLREAGFPATPVREISEDDEGGIWSATGSGLYRFQDGRISHIVAGNTVNIAAVASGVMLATVNPPGDPNDGTPQYQLFRIRREAGKWKGERLGNWIAMYGFTIDHSGSALFVCPGGWCELPRQTILKWRAGDPTKSIVKGETNAQRVLRDRFGCLWQRATQFATYACAGDAPKTLPRDIASLDTREFLFEAADGSMILPSSSSLAVGRPGAFQVARAVNGVPTSDLPIIAADGSIWIGSDEHGLYRMASPFRLEYWTARDGLETPLSITRADGHIYEGSPHGIRVLSDDRSRWTPLPHLDERGIIVQVLPGPDHTLYSAGAQITQMRYDGTVLAHASPKSLAFRLVNTPKALWASGPGIYQVRRQGDILRLIPELKPIPGNAAIDMEYEENTDTLWTCLDGLRALDKRGWRTITTADGLLENKCMSLAVMPTGAVWFGYLSKTAFSLVQKDKNGRVSVRQYYQSDGVGASDVVFLDLDSRSWLWRGSTSGGVHVADPADAAAGAWIELGEGDGLPSLSINQQSFYSDADSSVWWAADNTIAHFTPPKDFVRPTFAPSVFISGFSWDGGSPKMADGLRTIPYTTKLVAHVGSLQFDRRNNLHIRFRLGPEQAWKEQSWKEDHNLDIHLGRLPWGVHNLEVQSRLAGGPWSQSATHKFKIAKPFWFSWSALIVAVFAVVISAGAYGVLRHTRKERDRKLLPDFSEWRLAAFTPEIRNVLGTTIDGRYKAHAVLARGGFGTVLEGTDVRENRKCAIKVFRQELADSLLTRKFQQEVAALEAVQQPNVVRIYGHGMMPSGGPYLVMEFIEGTTLHKLLENGALPPERVARLLRQAAAALECIHSHGIYHRDFKPENVMIRKDCPQDSDLVLIDFSIAIVRDTDASMHGLSRAEGTFQYMAPEQILGYVGASNDIYSLAKVTLEMLTGKRLSELMPDASLDLAERVREFLLAYHVKLSNASIKQLCAALEFDPLRRPASVRLLTSTLADDLAGVNFSDDV